MSFLDVKYNIGNNLIKTINKLIIINSKNLLKKIQLLRMNKYLIIKIDTLIIKSFIIDINA